MIQVIFQYDEDAHKWEVSVTGAENDLERRNAFAAVVLTCQDLNPILLKHTRVEGDKIIPAV